MDAERGMRPSGRKARPETERDGASAIERSREAWRGTAIPPLNWLRTFEAAAWHASFTAASGELGITQSAVSQQIRNLEEALGRALFERHPQRVRLTMEGAIYADSIRQALGMMARASARMVTEPGEEMLTVHASPSFANRWLIPRLEGFRRSQPGVQVTIVSSNDTIDFERQTIDLAIRWGSGRWPGARARYLGDQPIIPVCSPAYLQERGPIGSLQDLSGQTLLHLTRDDHWAALLEMIDQAPAAGDERIFFNDTSPMLEACVQGHGIGLSSLLLAHGDLKAGRLVQTLDVEINVGNGFYVLSSEGRAMGRVTTLFYEWLLEEYDRTLVEAADRKRRTQFGDKVEAP